MRINCLGRPSGVEPLIAGPQPAVLPLNYDRHTFNNNGLNNDNFGIAIVNFPCQIIPIWPQPGALPAELQPPSRPRQESNLQPSP